MKPEKCRFPRKPQVETVRPTHSSSHAPAEVVTELMEHPFPYLAAVAERYGVDWLQVTDPLHRGRDSTSVVEGLTAADLGELAATYREILRREDAPRISKWLRETRKDRSRDHRKLWLLFVLFERLGERDLPPFNDGRAKLEEEPRPKLDWTKVPQSLQSLAPAAERYGDLRSDVTIDKFLENLDQAQIDRLVAVRGLCKKLEKKIWKYIDSHPIDQCQESAQLYWLMTFLDDGKVHRRLRPENHDERKSG